MSVTVEEIREAHATLFRARDEGLILGFAYIEVGDLDGRQTVDDFCPYALSDFMADAGLRKLREESRPGCNCDWSCTDEDCAEAKLEVWR